MLDIDFSSTGDDNLEPRCLRGCIGQDLQDTWATSSVATFVEGVNDKDKSVLGVARKGTDEIKEESAVHRLRSQVWVFTKVFCYNGSKRREYCGEFVDESRKNIYGLAQNRVIPPAEKGSSKAV